MPDRVEPDPEIAVAEANAAFYQAFEARSLEQMRAVWARSAPVSCIHPGWPPLYGIEAVIASWAGIFRGTLRVRFRLRNPQVFVAGETAWVVLVEELAADQEGGERMHVHVLATNTFVRENGGWRIVHHHASPAPQGDEALAEPPPILH